MSCVCCAPQKDGFPCEKNGLLSSSPVYEPPSQRFLVFAQFVLISFIGGYSINMVQAAESTAMATYAGLSVPVLSTIQLASQVPGMLCEPLMLNVLGMRRFVLLMGALQVVGYLCMGGLPFIYANTEALQVYIGNAFVGFTAGAMYIPIAMMVTTWFPDSERIAMIGLGLNAGNIGTPTGYFMCEVLAGSNHVHVENVPHEHVVQMRSYLNVFSIVPILGLVSASLFMESEPETPPSAAAHEQRVLVARRKEEGFGLLAALVAPWTLWFRDMRETGFDGFVISIVGFAAFQVSIYTTATYIPDSLVAFGYSWSTVAAVGASFYYLNVLGASTLAPLISSRLNPRAAVMVLGLIVGALQLTCFGVILGDLSGTAFIGVILALGLMSAPAQAVACDFGCDTMFPTDENSVMFWQMVIGQCFTALCNVLFGCIRDETSPVPYGYGYLIELSLAVVFLLFCSRWKGRFKRSEKEAEAKF